jgi:hypothetical protein
MPKQRKVIPVYLSGPLASMLYNICAKWGLSESEVLRHALLEWLDFVQTVNPRARECMPVVVDAESGERPRDIVFRSRGKKPKDIAFRSDRGYG